MPESTSTFNLQPGASAGVTEGDYEKYRDALFTFHLQTGTLPTIKVLNDEVTKTSDLAVAGGIYSDIWLGKWLGKQTVSLSEHSASPYVLISLQVALKALRHIKANDTNARQVSENC
jgi:hypothetical protein